MKLNIYEKKNPRLKSIKHSQFNFDMKPIYLHKKYIVKIFKEFINIGLHKLILNVELLNILPIYSYYYPDAIN